MKGFFFSMGIALTLFVLVVAAFGVEKPAGTFSTNIDLKKKTILDDSGWPSPPLSPGFWGAFREASSFLKDFLSVADPAIKYVRVKPGLRKEEIAELLGEKFDWSDQEKKKFLVPAGLGKSLSGKEGIFHPGIYFLPENIDAVNARVQMIKRFEEEVLSRYASSTERTIPIETALKIASIIEREAGNNDMRLVSGVIWNRLFREMSLDMDATLQYIKGSSKTGWWPRVLSDDKRLDSPYNTYQNLGLPPTAIANPGLPSIEAALNPEKTDYLYYIHDRYGRFHGAKNYKEHLKNIERYLK